MRESLKFIVSLVHTNLPNISKADLINHAKDYHLYQPIVNMGQFAPMMAQMTGNVNEIVSLNEITLSAEEFCAIVREVYGEENAQQNEVNDIGIFKKYIQNLRKAKPDDKVNEADVNATREDVEQTYRRIREVAASGVNNADRAYGLVVGHVQSGKTRNYIGLALKAYEDGYNVVIVLTSNNTALASQTNGRVMQELQTAGCNPYDLGFLTGNLYAGQIGNGLYYFGMAQKEMHHLERIQNWFNNHQNESQNIKLLVIDDESDNATPNTNGDSNAGELSDGDVVRIADDILASGEEAVSNWVRGLVEENYDENNPDVINARTLLNTHDGRTGIINLMRDENQVVCQLLKLNKDVGINDQQVKLAERVVGVFNNINRNGNNPVRNWRTLRDLAWYCFNVRPTRSRINQAIVTLFSRIDKTAQYGYNFQRLAYVGYTATPYANVLNENPESDPLASDFMFPMHKSNHYFGMARIFGEPTGQNDYTTNMNIVRQIDQDQTLIDRIRELYNGQGDDGEKITVNENLVVIYQERPDLVACVRYEWDSLKTAIAWLFCAAASRRLRRMSLNDDEPGKISNRWTTMLFNIGSEKNLHSYQKGIIQQYLNSLVVPEVRDQFINRCYECWENERARFAKADFENACPDYGSKINDYYSWDQLNEGIRWFLDRVLDNNRVHVVEVNCSRVGEEDLEKFKNTNGIYSNNNDDHIWIVCGGNKISRGLTLEGLVVTYFDRVRTSTCVDTLLQMGRWFGYREGYELLPRLWMNSDTIKEFKKMAKVERLMHRDLKEAFEAYPEYTPKDRGHYARIMQYGRNLSGRTAAAICSLASSGTGDVINAVSSAHRQDVLCVLSGFINQLGVNNQLNRPETIYCSRDNDNDTGFHAYPYWRNVSAEQIRGFLTGILQYAPTGEARSKINALNGEVVTCPWDIVISNQVPKGNPISYEIANGLPVRLANNEITSVQGDVVKFGKFVGDRHAFFSGVKTEYIVQAEVSMIREMLQDPTWSPLNNVTREECQTAIEQAAGNCMLDARIRSAAGLVRMSGKNYRDVVFSQILQAECINPILQISLVRPSGNGLQVEGTLPFVVLSFYWPNRTEAERYWWISAGFNENDGEAPRITSQVITEHINQIVKRHYFLQKSVLRELLRRELGGVDISDNDFDAAFRISHCNEVNGDIPDQIRRSLRAGIVYDCDWMDDWKQSVRETFPGVFVTDCLAICLQLQTEARDILYDNHGCMSLERLNAGMLARGIRRDNIVKDSRFDLLFDYMGQAYGYDFKRIRIGNNFLELDEEVNGCYDWNEMTISLYN